MRNGTLLVMGDTAENQARYVSFPRFAGHNSWLDGLRAAAILLVLLRHGVRALPEPTSSNALVHAIWNFCQNGWVGVDLFFVLSGYLIGRSLLSRLSRDADMPVTHYFEDRILRIVPAYFAVLAAICLGLFPAYVAPAAITPTTILHHLVFLQDYLGSNINAVFWSLGVEEKFYILAPLLVMALMRARSTRLGLIFLAAMLLISPLSRLVAFTTHPDLTSYHAFFVTLRSPFHMSLDCLLMGVAVAWLQSRDLLILKPDHAMALFLASGAAMTIWLCSHTFLAQINAGETLLQPFVIAILFSSMVLAAASLAKHRTMPGEPPLRIISRLSYALYLVHFPLIPICVAISLSAPAVSGPVFWIIYLSASFSAAMVLHFGIEKPFLMLKQKRAQSRSSSATHAPVLAGPILKAES